MRHLAQAVRFAVVLATHACNTTLNDKLLMCCTYTSQVMEPVRSRCLCVRVPGPSHAQIQEQLSLVARKEGLSVPAGLGERVALLSQRNLRRALLTLEVAYVQHGGLDDQTKVQPPDWELYCMVRLPVGCSARGRGVCVWKCAAAGVNGMESGLLGRGWKHLTATDRPCLHGEDSREQECCAAAGVGRVEGGLLCEDWKHLTAYMSMPFLLCKTVRTTMCSLFITRCCLPATALLQEIANDMLQEQSPKRLYQVRGKLYELLGNCIPAELILRALLVELLRKLDDELKVEVVKHAAFYEHRLQEGQKPIFHLEAFVAKFMALYKQWMQTNFG
jgi:hypothetical protein